MSEGSDDIDVDRVHRELSTALEADRRYHRENDAKFRAVYQNVGSYEEFRDIVKASHIKPLARSDIVSATRHQPWNPITSDGNVTNTSTTTIPDSLSNTAVIPSNAQEFVRQWRKLKGSPSEQYK
jgi:hypothetical protein